MGLPVALQPRRDARDGAAARPARRLRHHLLRGLRPPDEGVPRRRTTRSGRRWRTSLARFKALPPRTTDGETIQNEVYAAGKAAGFEPLRAWFQGLYEVLLGQSQGPRFGNFAALFGLDRTIELIERALGGEDLSG